jgi:uncharacterized membrane protein YfhO
VAYEPERVEIRATLAQPGLLVLADTYYPGWTAEVDGQAAEIVPADLYLRGVALDAGDHTVVLRFRPASVRIGLTVSLVAWMALAVAAAVLALRIGRGGRTGV